jgi:hypothetical protein
MIAAENTAFVQNGIATIIYAGEELPAGLTPYVAPAPIPPTIAQIQAQLESDVQSYLDSKAQIKGYDSAASCISYLNSTNTAWKADATAMNSGRDAVWSYCYTNTASATPSTTWAQLQPLLPAAPW